MNTQQFLITHNYSDLYGPINDAPKLIEDYMVDRLAIRHGDDSASKCTTTVVEIPNGSQFVPPILADMVPGAVPSDRVACENQLPTIDDAMSGGAIMVDGVVWPSVAVAKVDELRTKNITLEAELAGAKSALESVHTQLHNGRRALELIGDRLIEEANNRDWCSIYDDVIESLNGQLPSGWELPVRSKNWDVTVEFTVRLVTTVTAQDDDDAENIGYHELSEDRLHRYLEQNYCVAAVSHESCSAEESDD
jgi:hypothetical protein